MRVKRAFNTEIDYQTKPDGYVTLHKNGYPDVKERVIKLELPSSEIETLITNVWNKKLNPTFSFLRRKS